MAERFDLPGILKKVRNTDISSYLEDANKFILTANSKLGIAGYDFVTTEKYKLTAASEVTDHRIETGDFIHNYIANKPIELEITGLISEVYFENDTDKSKFLTALAKTSRYAFSISSKLNVVASGTQKLLDLAKQGGTATLSDVSNTSLDIYAGVKDNFIDNDETTKAVKFFIALREAKEPIAITTPFGVFDQMALTLVDFSTDNTMVGATRLTLRMKRTTQVDIVGGKEKPLTIDQAAKNVIATTNKLVTGATQSFDKLTDFFGG